MNRILIYTLFLVITFLFGSCADALDIKPEDRQSITNAFDDDAELMGFLISIQGEVQRLISNDTHQPMGTAADICDNIGFSNLRDLVPATVKSSLYSDWSEYYDVIYICNLILENIDQAQGNIPQDRIDFYTGQAHFFKGWMYFELGRIWGNAIITTGTNNFEAYGNSADYEVIAEAIKSMEAAHNLLGKYGELTDDDGNALLSKQYGNKGAAAGLLAHMYAWQGSMAELYNWPSITPSTSYTKSVEWCTSLISGDNSGEYALAPNISSMLDQNFNGYEPITRSMAMESILEAQRFYLPDNSGGYINPIMERYFTWPVDTNAGTADIESGRVAFKFEASTIQNMYKGTDERKDGYFFKVDSMAAAGHPFAFPYKVKEGVFRVTSQTTGRTSMTGLNCNSIYIRLAGIYLLRAECYAKLGNDAAAIQDLNVIRNRAKAAPYPAPDDQDLQYAIFKEREKELLMENGRYYDVLRNNYIDTELPEAFSLLSDQDIQDGALYLHIGQAAFTNNSLLKQNIYWNRVD
ncbi:RagB/SusD family nutrient uptake outer membrane protein [Galbibacter mesophilus]|uniref:RagB/SusD family nutrient uptake outer membrane protein n=1 Tax=Galbibacter mesophilus TaxID=379069 RepID=UPI0019202D81|nr:RagB/SusD family nutrient uptake outer membrane protein [Galbibacter mesophilus]MCM5662657.1 RagB/SusD family nutrient uptake outer membrane protein [Galbibacter mesophilus]